MKLSIVIPCFNEADTIESVVEKVEAAALSHGWTKEIIIVDDGSDSATKAVLARIERRLNPPIVLRRERNGGKGAAVKDGLMRATGEYILIQDADLEYDPSDYSQLLIPVTNGTADVVFGSRAIRRNNVPYNAFYFYGGLLVTKIFNLLFGTRLSDIASCYKLFPRRFIPELLQSDHNDFVFDSVVLTLALTKGGSIAEVPISYTARRKQEGKKLNVRHATKIVAALLLTRFGFGSARAVSFFAQVIRFLVTGSSAATINVTMLYLLTEFANMWYLYSSIYAFTVAFAFSFSFQKYWVFRSDDHRKIPRQLPLHLGVALGNLVLNTILLYAFVEYLHIWYVLAQLLASALIAIESFVLFRLIFR